VKKTSHCYNLITAEYIPDNDIPVLYLITRRDDGKKEILPIVCKDLSLRPRFFAPTVPDAIRNSNRVLDILSEPRKSIYGPSLYKIYTKLPADVGKLREMVKNHHEADIQFPYVILVQEDIKIGFERTDAGKIKPTEPLNLPLYLFYIDIEVASPPEEFPDYRRPRFPIVLITTWNSKTNSIIAFFYHPNFPPGSIDSNGACSDEYFLLFKPLIEKAMLRDEYTGMKPDFVEIRFFNNEKFMLRRFAEHLVHIVQPDELIAYNWPFDGNYLIARMNALRVGADKLSPLGSAYSRSAEEVVIKGYDCFDILRGFKELWTMAFGELSSWKFTSVIEHPKVFGKPKTEFWLGHQIEEAWNKDPASLLWYGIDDAKDSAALIDKFDVINFYSGIREEAGCSLSDALSYFKALDICCLRDKEFVLPSGHYVEKFGKTTGPIVFEPVPGIHEDVGQVDAKSLYVNMIRLNNIGIETEDPNGEHAVEIFLFGRKETIRFKRSPEGILSRIVNKFEKRRDAVRDKMVGLDKHSIEYRVLYQRQNGIKFLTSALPGLLGNEAFRLFNQRIHAAVMFSGRECTEFMSEIAEDEGFKTLYGDTDSVFLKRFRTITEELSVKDHLEQTAETINTALYGKYGSKKFFVKVEDIWQSIFFGRKKSGEARKKCYAGITQDGELKIVGLAAIRSDSAPITVEVLLQVYNLVLKEKDVNGALKVIYSTKEKFEQLSPQEIAVPKGLSMDPDEYGVKDENKNFVLINGRKKGVPAHARGAVYARKHLHVPLGSGTKVRYIWIRRVKDPTPFGEPRKYPKTNVLSFEHESQVPWEIFDIDYSRMFGLTVMGKVEDIFEALGITRAEILAKQRTAKLTSFEELTLPERTCIGCGVVFKRKNHIPYCEKCIQVRVKQMGRRGPRREDN